MIVDLHIHSRFAAACSKEINLKKLEEYARLKGIDVMGTGDFTHPKWIQELKQNLTPGENGVLWSKNKYPFILQTEISLIYTQGGKGRRIHHIVLAPSFDVVDQITEMLLTKGRVDYDGRPIFGMSSIEFLERLRDISKDIEIIPAHAWTPWFGILGSKSGFDSIEECFEEKSKYIHAIETGLSSDPPMNWRVSSLDRYNMVSFSDLHSFWPWRIGREATMMDIKLTYNNILNAIRTGKGLDKTIEVIPNYGKYHFDGHRACNVVFSPEESKKLKGICPKCKKPLTIGVQYRIDELADRPEGYVRPNAPEFLSIIPLSELIASVYGIKMVSSKTVWKVFNELTAKFGSEYNILLKVSPEDLKKVADPGLVEVIIKNREGKLDIEPGYDGIYGKIILDKNQILNRPSIKNKV